MNEVLQRDAWHSEDQFGWSQYPVRTRSMGRLQQFIMLQMRKQQSYNHALHRVLDAGCGDGVTLEVLSNLQRAELYGVECNPLRIRSAREHFPNAQIVSGDLTVPLEFPDRYFDVIILSQVIEHIDEIKCFERVLTQN